MLQIEKRFFDVCIRCFYVVDVFFLSFFSLVLHTLHQMRYTYISDTLSHPLKMDVRSNGSPFSVLVSVFLCIYRRVNGWFVFIVRWTRSAYASQMISHEYTINSFMWSLFPQKFCIPTFLAPAFLPPEKLSVTCRFISATYTHGPKIWQNETKTPTESQALMHKQIFWLKSTIKKECFMASHGLMTITINKNRYRLHAFWLRTYIVYACQNTEGNWVWTP